MACPQCGAQLGEGAKGCVACGWSASRKTLWIVLGSIFGFLFLVCCGGGTLVGLRFKEAAEKVQATATPVVLTYHRLSVLNFTKVRGELPATLVEAAQEPLEMQKKGGGDGDTAKFEFKMQKDGKDLDTWERPIRYTVADEKTYEVRSAGPDGVFDNADDLFEAGSVDDDLDELKAAFQKQAEEFGRRIGMEFVRSLGLDPDEGESEPDPVPVAPVDPAQPVEPLPPPGGGGGGEDGGK